MTNDRDLHLRFEITLYPTFKLLNNRDSAKYYGNLNAEEIINSFKNDTTKSATATTAY